MARGAKAGENRFKGAQAALVNYRTTRIKEVVIPGLKTLSTHANIGSVNKFCHLAAELFNKDLPLNDKPISYRRLHTSPEYWKLLGPIYFRHFEKRKDLDDFKKDSKASNLSRKLKDIESENTKLKTELKAIKSFLAANPEISNKSVQHQESTDSERLETDKEHLCKIINKLIVDFGVIEVSIANGTMHNLANDNESIDGMFPKEIVKPYIEWLKLHNDKFGGN